MARRLVSGARAGQLREGQLMIWREGWSSQRRKGQSMARGPVIKAQGPINGARAS